MRRQMSTNGRKSRQTRPRCKPLFEALEQRQLMTASPGSLGLAPIGTYATGTFDGSGAEIVAHDPASQRLFFTNADQLSVGVLDISDPINPTLLATIDVSTLNVPGLGLVATGGPNSVAVSNGLVAVAVEADPVTDPGYVAFFDTNGTFLSAVIAGSLPDSLTFTPDGQTVLVANEGEPAGGVDPPGSVSIIDISAGGASVLQTDVTDVDFSQFDGQEERLRNKGVRIFPGVPASLDLEPEYAAVSPDGTTAFVTLQEANSFAVIDIASATVIDISPLGLKDHGAGLPEVTTFDFTDLPDLGTTATGEVIKFGGLSGLTFDGMTTDGKYRFLAVPDRGPNGDPIAGQRPFLLPEYQARIVEFTLDPTTGQLQITNTLLLTRQAAGPQPSLATTAVPQMNTTIPNAAIQPLFTVGDTLPDGGSGYTPVGILDGMGAFELDANTVRVFATHELASSLGAPYTLANSTVLTGARISFFDIDKASRQIVSSGPAYDTIIAANGLPVTNGSMLGNGGGLARLCSAVFVQGGSYNFVDDIFFTGEESSNANGGLGGLQYALDAANGVLYAVPAMGYAAWENVTPLDTGNANKTALLIGDDRGGAPLYLWVGDKGLDAGGSPASDFLARNGLAHGALYAWKADNGDTTPADFRGTGNSRSGSWVEITNLASIAAQDAEVLSKGGFRFSRPEDVATDPNDGTRAVLASTGLSSLFGGVDSWGTTYLIDVDFDVNGVPTSGQIDVLYDGDDAGAGQFAGPDYGLRSPDNLDWADDGFIYVQEDRSVGGFGAVSGQEASMWKLDPGTGELTRIGKMNRSAVPPGQFDNSPADLGNWESSGILDVSNLFGATPGSLLLFNVQGHSLRGGPIASQNLVEGGQLAFFTRGDAFGTPITGLPNLVGVDEVPVDAAGNPINLPHAPGGYDPFGGDLEGIVRDPNDDTFWMVDEYRPAIYHFGTDGVLINRFIPQGTAAQVGDPAGTYGDETLPSDYLTRRSNRGFEAVAYDTDNDIVYAFIQTPLANPNNAASNASNVIRMLGIDPATGTPVAEYVYLLEKPELGGNVDKIGDAVYAGDGKFTVIERDSDLDSTGHQFVFEINLKGATNVLGVSFAPQTLEQSTADDLVALGIQPVAKRKITNLPSIGYLPTDKTEGISLLPDGRLAVINDNDFGIVPGVDKIQLGIVSFTPAGLDASDRDNVINIQPWPVFGMFLPDAISSFEIAGRTYYITANEGDDRGENARVSSLTLDPTVFPNAAALQANAALGRLSVSTIDGDLDGDGDYDQLLAYGARSFTIWDANANLVFDSGEDFEQITAMALPDFFNSSNDETEFDSRSDAKGPEPEAVTTGVIDGATYAFVGLERIGGIMMYDVSDPTAPVFIRYVNNRNFLADPETPEAGDLGVEDLKFISAADSPNGFPLLVAANEVSGTVTIFQIDNMNPSIETDADGGQLTVRRVGDNLQVTRDAAGQVLLNRPLSSVESLTIDGQDLRRDTLTIDLSGGPIGIPGGIQFNAGDGGFGYTRRDILSVIGSPEQNQVELRPDELVVNGLSILYDDVEVLDIELGSGDDTVAIEGTDAQTTLHDLGGSDTLDFSNAPNQIRLHLRLDRGQLQSVGVARLGLDGTFENVIGSAFNDRILGNEANNLLQGGGGDDQLDGFAGDNILVGGAGNDFLYGGRQRDILIGGTGSDLLIGQLGSDLLIASSTDHDDDPAALLAIQAEWVTAAPLATRIANLENGGGANGSVRVKKDETVHDDGVRDLLFGRLNEDWLVAYPGDLGF